MINQDRMIFSNFSVNFEPISLEFCKGHFLLNHNSCKKFAKLFPKKKLISKKNIPKSIFQEMKNIFPAKFFLLFFFLARKEFLL